MRAPDDNAPSVRGIGAEPPRRFFSHGGGVVRAPRPGEADLLLDVPAVAELDPEQAFAAADAKS
jgi:hypothetical protein